MLRRWISPIVIAWALGGLLVSQSDGQDFSEQRPARADGIVEVLNVSGSVSVIGWDRPFVSVEGTVGEGTEQVAFTGDEYRTTIEVVLEEGVTHPGPTRLTVRIPADSRVEVGTVHADVTIEDVAGEVFLNTVDGNVRVSGRPREVEAKSLKGDIHLAVTGTRAKLSSAAGQATLIDMTGEADVSTVSGNVIVEGGLFERGQFRTVSGDLAFFAGLRRGGAFDFSSHSGSITLRLPVSVPADFMVSSHEGRIVNELAAVASPVGAPAARERMVTSGPRRGRGRKGRAGGGIDRNLIRTKSDRTRMAFSTGSDADSSSGDRAAGALSERTRVVVYSFSGDVALKRK
jgi:hypothetical protein